MNDCKIKQYVVDAFADRVFSGNPAAVCILDDWLPEAVMLDIAMENNLSETAFAVKNGEQYELRWFTPGGEVDLCGHATLATAYVILRFYEIGTDCVTFQTMKNTLVVRKKGTLYEMVFPAYQLEQVPVTQAMTKAIGAEPREAYLDRDLLCVFETPDLIENM